MNWIERKTGVHPNTKCFVCGITAAKSFKKGPVDTGINHPEYFQTYSFYYYGNNKHYCPRCHKEAQLKGLFDLMDKREQKELDNNKKNFYPNNMTVNIEIESGECRPKNRKTLTVQ